MNCGPFDCSVQIVGRQATPPHPALAWIGPPCDCGVRSACRALAQAKPMMAPEQELSNDPDNVPPRSRLFIVVPKQADSQSIQVRIPICHFFTGFCVRSGQGPERPRHFFGRSWCLQDDLGAFPDLEYCKTDLIANKGVVFCKFTRSSSALRALEEITERAGGGTVSAFSHWDVRVIESRCQWIRVRDLVVDLKGLLSAYVAQVAGYKVKCMLAEPKTKRGRPDAMQDVFSPMHSVSSAQPSVAATPRRAASPLPVCPWRRRRWFQ